MRQRNRFHTTDSEQKEKICYPSSVAAATAAAAAADSSFPRRVVSLCWWWWWITVAATAAAAGGNYYGCCAILSSMMMTRLVVVAAPAPPRRQSSFLFRQQRLWTTILSRQKNEETRIDHFIGRLRFLGRGGASTAAFIASSVDQGRKSFLPQRLFGTKPELDSNGNNPTLDWKGVSRSNDSIFTEHILIPSDAATATIPTLIEVVAQAVEQRQKRDGSECVMEENENSSSSSSVVDRAHQLIDMGSVWFLPVEAPRDPTLGVRPRRLSAEDLTMTLRPGDYLRIHTQPRRFPVAHLYDWNAPYINNNNNKNNNDSHNSTTVVKPGVIVAEDKNKGWLVINKPAPVPIHMTVDNCLENAQACLYHARQQQKQQQRQQRTEDDNDNDENYVGIVQRLDQNTSGLAVIATNKLFATYFPHLLRTKTAQLGVGGGVHKVYKCLVCLLPSKSQQQQPWSVASALQFLHQSQNTTIRHWLEPSIRAPKRYVSELPPDWKPAAKNEAGWLESLLKITHVVGTPFPLIGNAAGETLAQQLFASPDAAADADAANRMPTECQAVVELKIELLTGRTHQIRGQLAAMGFPLVGDVQYGGAVPLSSSSSSHLRLDQQLALQCCQVEFLDPELVEQSPKPIPNPEYYKPRQPRPQVPLKWYKPSTQWNQFLLDRAWWTPYLEQYHHHHLSSLNEEGSDDAVTMSAEDPVLLATTTTTIASTNNNNNRVKMTNEKKKRRPRPEFLPNRVQLSPGKNKYVLIRAVAPSSDNNDDDNKHEEEAEEEEHWFVKSATPKECGGLYHGNVAQDLREWIEAAGFEVTVMGGGRINYSPEMNQCLVYGFSYGFGKGNHEHAAALIRHHTGIPATFDDTDGIY